MKVAFVLAALGAGGAERVTAILAGEAAARGWDVTTITFDAPGDPIYHPLDHRVRLQRLAIPTGKGGPSALVATIRRVLALRRTLVRERFDVVIAFLTKINAVTLLANLGRQTPVIVSERNNPTRQGAHPLWQRVLKPLYGGAAAIVMQTQRARAGLPSAQQARAVVIANPIPRLPLPPVSPHRPTLVAVGRLTEQKGFDLLIDAFGRVAGEFPEWTLTIFGDGPQRRKLERMVEDRGMNGRILLPGSTRRHGEWIDGAAVFVLPSRYEGFPNVLGEAMQAGLPVIAFDCDYGPAEMIEDGRSGVLVPPENVAELANALRGIMDSEARRVALGAMALLQAAKFEPEACVQAWFDLIATYDIS